MAFHYHFYLKNSKNHIVFKSPLKAYGFAINTINSPTAYRVDVFDNSGNLINKKAKLKEVFDMPDKKIEHKNIYKDIFPRTKKPNQPVIRFKLN